MPFQEFPYSVIDRLGYYVYILTDPAGKIFYVGKGTGNRIFAHVNEATNACSTGSGGAAHIFVVDAA